MSKKSLALLLVAVIMLSSSVSSFAEAKQVSATIPSFQVRLNGLEFNQNDYAKYPLLVYRDITYFPMTYYQSNLLNLNTKWTSATGLIIEKDQSEVPKQFAYETPNKSKNKKTQSVKIITEKVTVNGKVIDNTKEQYPLILFRDVTYFPITWRFAVEEFGWKQSFDKQTGLDIKADNYFYTANGDSYKEADGDFLSVDNETCYIKGNLRVYITTETAKLIGPQPQNLSIMKSGVEINPQGYFGYYQKNGPLFTLDGNFIRTSYYTDSYKRDTKMVKVNIETGEVILD